MTSHEAVPVIYPAISALHSYNAVLLITVYLFYRLLHVRNAVLSDLKIRCSNQITDKDIIVLQLGELWTYLLVNPAVTT